MAQPTTDTAGVGTHMVTVGLFCQNSGPMRMFHSFRVIGVTSEAETGVFGPRRGVPAREGTREGTR